MVTRFIMVIISCCINVESLYHTPETIIILYVNGTSIGSCLGDEYSVRFMEDIDSRPGEALKDYTMQEQYEYLVKAVLGSHVQQYGDLNIAQESLYYYLSDQTGKLLKIVTQIASLLFPPVETRNLEERATKKIDNWEYRLENLT